MKGLVKLAVIGGAAMFGTATSIAAYRYRTCKSTEDVKQQFATDKKIITDLTKEATQKVVEQSKSLRSRMTAAYRGFCQPAAQ